MADDPIYPSDEDLNNAKAMLETMNSMNSSYESLVKTSTSLKDTDSARALVEIKLASEAQKLQEQALKQIKSARELGVISKEKARAIYDQHKKEIEISKEIQKQQVLEKASLEAARQKLGFKKEEKKTQEEITKEAEKQVRAEKAKQVAQNFRAVNTQTGHVTNMDMGAGGARTFVDTAAQKAAEGISGIFGKDFGGDIGAIIGVVKALSDLKSIGDVAAATLIKANASAGTLVKNTAKFADMSNKFNKLKSSTTIVQTYGMTFKEMTGKLNAAAQAGLSLNEVMDNDYQGLLELNSASVATGVDISTMSRVMVEMKRNLKDFTTAGNEALKLAGAAQAVAQKQIMNTSEFVNLVGGLTDELADLNMSVDQTITLASDLMLNIKQLGVSAKVTKDITGQLTKSFHTTSEEWKAFIGSQSGFGGGFTGALFGAEQRGPGGDLLTRQADPKVWMTQVMNTINRMTAGMTGNNRVYMAQRLGQQFGLGPQATQALLKNVTTGRGLTGPKGIEELVNAAKKDERDSKSQFEKLAAILEGTIAKILNGILKAVLWIANKAGMKVDIEDLMDQKKAQAKLDTTPPHKAGGGTIYNTGLIVAHRDEEVLSPNIARAYRSGKQNTNSINLNVVVNYSGGDLKKAFDKAHQDTLRQIKRSQTVAYGM